MLNQPINVSHDSSNNPWLRLPNRPPYVLEEDSGPIVEFNCLAEAKYNYNLFLHPEPFVGSLEAPVYLLALNPGVHLDDFKVHQSKSHLEIFRKAASQSADAKSLYYLSKEFENTPGANWWKKKLSRLISVYGNQHIAESLCCIQLYPYHSHRFSRIPGITNTLEYTFSVIRKAITHQKVIVVMRSWSQWKHYVPELDSYRYLIKIKNPRNPCLTSNNMSDQDFANLLRALAGCP